MRYLIWLLLAGVACESTAPSDDKPPAEICDNLEDDDLDDLADCADPDCAALCGEVCTNGTDDDLDGLVDCMDDDCDGLCPENCGDGRDNDADGAIDCDDRDCFGSCPEVCGDGFDNDGDGKVDCLDEECVDPSCDEICTDDRDNDADGLIDCEDDDCSDPSCIENCTDGRDNDADGRVDCDDTDCDGACPEVCTDGRDNDADGRIDCEDDECAELCDADGDGFFNAEFGGDDCDDTRFDVNPSRPEICNGDEVLDDDCDGLFDEDDPDIDPLTLIAWGRDADGDGYGTNSDLFLACQGEEGFGFAGTDCNDLRADVHPGMPEICNPDEPLDDDCDGLVDDADPDVTPDSYLEWFADRDGDGFGADDDFEYACSRPDGTAASNDDCDDADPEIGRPSLWYVDADGDGWAGLDGEPVSPTPSCEPPYPGLGPDWRDTDCDDTDPLTYPGAPEICDDDIDQDCNGDPTCCGHYLDEHTAEGSQGQWCYGDALVNYRNYGEMTFDDCQCIANRTGTQWFGGEWSPFPTVWIGDHDAANATVAGAGYWSDERVVPRTDTYACVLGQFEHRTEPSESPVEEIYVDAGGRRWHYWRFEAQTHSQVISFADDHGARVINPNSVGHTGVSAFTQPTHWCHAGAEFNGPGDCNSDNICNFFVGYFD